METHGNTHTHTNTDTDEYSIVAFCKNSTIIIKCASKLKKNVYWTIYK